MRKLVLFGIASVVALAATASARQIVPAIGPIHGGGGVGDTPIVYSNIDNLLGFLIVGNNSERGDGVALAGTDRVVTEIGLVIHALGQDWSADTVVRLYEGGNNFGASDPGALLWDSGMMSGLPYPNGSNLHNFAVPNVLVPDEITWTIELTNIAGGTGDNRMGSRFMDPPTIGSSENNVWLRETDGSWTAQQFGVGGDNNYGAIINAVPEPATLVLLGLGGLALVRRRR